MKRLAFFSFFDKDGIVDDYVIYYLENLKICIDEIIIITNGELSTQEKEKLQRISPFIFSRENRGFDVGGYSYLLNKIGQDYIQGFDEWILCNDTCYGPFVSFDEIFNTMEARKVDFWGLAYMDMGIYSHIQSYFLTFNRKILNDKRFWKYWYENIPKDESNRKKIFLPFERGIFWKLKEWGYKYIFYSDVERLDIYRAPDYAIKKYGLPVMKKKALHNEYFNKANVVNALIYISETEYPIKLILHHIVRAYNKKFDMEKISNLPSSMIRCNRVKSVEEIVRFCSGDDAIYLYGAGETARLLYSLCKKKSKNIAGYIVSDGKRKENEIDGLKVYEASELAGENIKVIVAMSAENSRELKEKIKRQWKKLIFLEEI
ncbi:MAG: rhamnan synthesis F family protein [Erysipelotrichaceae bacterium]|nr:rhamnan synthesis F family protein [Erysipelotrichaceae bacterium]